MVSSSSDLYLPKKAPSHRQLRVAEELKRVISYELMRGDFFTTVPIGSVTVTHITVSPDLRNATVYVAPLSGGANWQDTLSGLTEISHLLRKSVSREMRLKFTPALRFKSDESFDEAQHIESLLRQAREDT